MMERALSPVSNQTAFLTQFLCTSSISWEIENESNPLSESFLFSCFKNSEKENKSVIKLIPGGGERQGHVPSHREKQSQKSCPVIYSPLGQCGFS